MQRQKGSAGRTFNHTLPLCAALPLLLILWPASGGTGNAHASLFTDNFNRTSIGPNWTVVSSTWKIDVNKLYHQSTSGGKIVLNIPLGSNDYEAQASFQFTTLTSGNHRGLIARYQNSQNYYYGQYHRPNLKCRIIKVQNGVSTTLAESSCPGVSSNTYHTIKFKVEGSSLKLYFDGALKVQTQNSAFAQGKPGIYSQSYYHRFDDFSLTTFVSTPPFVTVDLVSSPTNQTQITLSGTKTANTSVRSNGTEIVPLNSGETWFAQVSLSEEGTNAFSTVARTPTGAESPPVVISVVRDTVPPVIQFTDPSPNSLVNQPQIFVYGTVDGVEFVMLAELEEGSNTVTKTATDAAGNESAVALSLTLDSIPPEIEIVSPDFNSWITAPDVTLQCRFDGVMHSHLVLLGNEGLNAVAVTHTDPAGNIGSITYALRLDSVPPLIEFASHGNGQIVSSSSETIVYTVDDIERTAEFPLLLEGPNEFPVSGTDAAGNQSMTSLTLIRDTTAPIFTVSFPEEGSYVNKQQVVG